MKTQNNKKIVRYRTFSFLNIGTVLFGVIFIYIIICLFLYLTTDHIVAYEVTAGPLAGNYRYSALALREEKLVEADQSGSIVYYSREGSKAGAGTAVCSINEGGAASIAPQRVSGTTEKENSLTQESLRELKDDMKTFSVGFQTSAFQSVYNFKANLESTLMEIAAGDSLQSMDGTFIVNACVAPEAGIVVYSKDGYEDSEPNEITADDFEQKNYEKENFRSNKFVKSGDEIYKLITNETWQLLIPLDEKMATELADQNSVKFRFLKDGTTFYADFEILKKGKSMIGQLTLDKCMGRFAAERFVDIELVLNRKSGLKIPNSAIAERVFYKIPEEYASYDREDDPSPDEVGLIWETLDKDGEIVQRHVNATVYDKVEDGFLIDAAQFHAGDYILMQNSMKRFMLSETEVLQGVYNINKGYAIFREITIIDQNEEYCIVEEGSSFGLAQYDHIVLEASTVNDEDIVIHY